MTTTPQPPILTAIELDNAARREEAQKLQAKAAANGNGKGKPQLNGNGKGKGSGNVVPLTRPIIPPPLSLDEVRQQLQEALAAGTSGTDLELLVQSLADRSEQHPAGLQRIVQSLRAELDASAAIEAEAQALAIEADRQEIAQALTLPYLLPPPIAQAIEARTRYLATSGPAATLMFLSTVAAATRLGTRIKGSAASGYNVPANLYACIVARSGASKSPQSRGLIREPLAPLVGTVRLKYEQRIEAWRNKCGTIANGKPKPPEPQQPHLIANDPTGEALAAVLQQNERDRYGLLLYRDELAGLFGSLNQYRGGRGGDKELLVELFDGGGMAQVRIVGGGRFFTRSQFSIYGTTQPDVLRELVADGDPNGLWARFLFAPLPAVPVRLPDDDDDTAIRAADSTLKNTIAEIHRLEPHEYELSRAARSRFNDHHFHSQNAGIAASTTLKAHGAIYGKTAGKVLRVAGLLHLAAIGAGTASHGDPIPDEVMERAVMLVDHLDGYAMGIHSDAASGGPSGLLRTVHRIVEANGQPLSPSLVRQRLSKAQRAEADTTAIAAAMKALAAAGYGEVIDGAKGATRYRASRSLP